MTPREAKRAKYAYEDYRFKALLSVLTDEQRKHFDEYMKQHLDEYKATLLKFLSPQEATSIINELKKVEKFA